MELLASTTLVDGLLVFVVAAFLAAPSTLIAAAASFFSRATSAFSAHGLAAAAIRLASFLILIVLSAFV